MDDYVTPRGMSDMWAVAGDDSNTWGCEACYDVQIRKPRDQARLTIGNSNHIWYVTGSTYIVFELLPSKIVV